MLFVDKWKETIFENYLIYENSIWGIKLKYPQSWQRQDLNNTVTGELVAFLSS